MKKILSIIIAVLLLPIMVNASSGTISVSGANTGVVGNKITVTVNLKGTALGSWEMDLNYDKSYLQLISSTAEGGGTYMVNASTSAIKSKNYTFTFKALKSGSTKLSVGSYSVYDFNDQSLVSISSSSSKTIKIMTQAELEASYSKDNNLKSLTVEGFDLTPTFDKDVLNYSVIVPEDTIKINVKAVASDSRSSIKGDGEIEVNTGANTVSVVVTAENGSEKTYTISVEVKDNNPIYVKVNNKDLSLVKASRLLSKPDAFEETTVTINDVEIPAFYNEICDITLVGLKSDDGKINLFIYDKDNNTYKNFVVITLDSVILMPIENDDAVEGYKLTDISIKDIPFKAHKFNDDSNFSIIYGVNLLTGEKGYYMYDSKLNTVITYNNEFSAYLLNQNKIFIYVICAFGGIVVILFIIIMSILHKKKNKKNIRNKNIQPKPKEEKEIIEL